MSVPPSPHTPAARNLELGMLLIGAGAILLLISLFLTWYQPEVDAWEIFEVWDLVLAVLAIVALVAVAGRLGFAPPRPASWLLAPAIAALVIVLYAIVNPPPLARTIDGDPDTGLWLALAASVLMAVGAVMSVARISVAIAGNAPGSGPASPRAGGGRFGHGPVAGDRYDQVDQADPVMPDRGSVPPGGAPPTEPTRRL